MGYSQSIRIYLAIGLIVSFFVCFHPFIRCFVHELCTSPKEERQLVSLFLAIIFLWPFLSVAGAVNFMMELIYPGRDTCMITTLMNLLK